MNSTPQKAKAPTVAADGALRNEPNQRQFSPKSTRSEAQRQRILAALRRRPQTSYDLRRLGCYQAPARIKELRDKFGYRIETQRVTVIDRDGYAHARAARYVLMSEPATT
jgi:hypothetical protein